LKQVGSVRLVAIVLLGLAMAAATGPLPPAKDLLEQIE